LTTETRDSALLTVVFTDAGAELAKQDEAGALASSATARRAGSRGQDEK
jgi:hypothetical protein